MNAAAVGVIGGGASGTLSAIHLAEEAADRSLHILVVEPAPIANGVAYSTRDPRHRLNVRASAMSAYPQDADHFVRWLRRHVAPDFPASGFAARMHYGEYLNHVLQSALRRAPRVSLEIVQTRATDVRKQGRRWRVSLADGTSRPVDAIILALGSGTPSTTWAPPELARSARFVPDPWAIAREPLATGPRQVVLVGAGLTMADMAMSWGRDGTRLHVVSRHGLLPVAHEAEPSPRPAPPELPAAASYSLPSVRHLVFDHVRSTIASGRDWRSAIDSLRPCTAELWGHLSAEDRVAFQRSGARRWNRARHRVEPGIGDWLDNRIADGSLVSHSGTVLSASETPEGLHLRLSNGLTLAADLVINCTGPVNDVTRSADPLMMNLLESRTARPGSAGLGLDCDADGRLVGGTSSRALIWTVGPLRQGRLWESTAIPEIRDQSAEVAASVLASLPRAAVRRRPRDPYGLPLSSTADAAAVYVEGLGRILRVQSGAEAFIHDSVRADPDFALGHATLALLGSEWGADVDAAAALAAAHRGYEWADEREVRFIDAVTARVQQPGADSAAALIAYIHAYPEDALAVSMAVPTIAFAGATEIPAEAWALVEGLAPAYGGDWWYRSLLAFIRQEQERYDEAAHLADLALAVEPGSGHAVHARTHAYYETGQHTAGLAWLDMWIASCGRAASHRAHFSWHAALHELALGDDAAAARRYASQLAPTSVTGVRALVDSASLLWRGYTLGAWEPDSVREVIGTVPAHLLAEPPTAFIAMHAAVALAAAGDCRGLARLRRHAAGRAEAVFATTVAPLAQALICLIHGDADQAAVDLLALQGIEYLGGSAAQREIIQETLLFSSTEAGLYDVARSVLVERLDRRPSPRDSRRMQELQGKPETTRLAAHRGSVANVKGQET